MKDVSNWIALRPGKVSEQPMWETLSALRRNTVVYAILISTNTLPLTPPAIRSAWASLRAEGWRVARIRYQIEGRR